jgi:hypothetical protein
MQNIIMDHNLGYQILNVARSCLTPHFLGLIDAASNRCLTHSSHPLRVECLGYRGHSHKGWGSLRVGVRFISLVCIAQHALEVTSSTSGGTAYLDLVERYTLYLRGQAQTTALPIKAPPHARSSRSKRCPGVWCSAPISSV